MFGAILGLAGAIGGSFAQNRADKRAFRLQQENTARAMGLLDAGETRASDFLRQALEAVDAGRGAALGQTAQAEFQGYRALQDALGQGQSRLAQSLASRGLYGTSAAGAGLRGMYADYGRAVGNLGAQLGSVRAGIEQNTAAGRAGVFTNQAQTAGQFAQSRAGIQANIQYQAPQGLSQNYALLGQALGGALDGWGSWASRRTQMSQSNAALGGIGSASQAAGRALGPTPFGYALQGYGSALKKARY